ncbi:hypothetical protein [Pseudomonas benzenivorans]|uniref:Uncharacterized protein n=1 Tax=Pseudomonas benzenivorans TaxID=556533 RepID=A0ABY5H4A9_9PSED|nr:hypothetical protein [Pseudomonas benzenivorans]UTW06626.1 hypothetical protein KDW96_15815 [Pseudomonas benzenivorans]
MNISIQSPSKSQGSCWQVRFGKNQVSFRSEAEARAFVATLEARLQAPHPLPLAAS